MIPKRASRSTGVSRLYLTGDEGPPLFVASRPKAPWPKIKRFKHGLVRIADTRPVIAAPMRSRGIRGVNLPYSRATNALSGDDLDRVVPVPATYAIGLEVLTIDGEDFPRGQRFGGGDERCVRQIHRMIRVQLHEFEGAS